MDCHVGRDLNIVKILVAELGVRLSAERMRITGYDAGLGEYLVVGAESGLEDFMPALKGAYGLYGLIAREKPVEYEITVRTLKADCCEAIVEGLLAVRDAITCDLELNDMPQGPYRGKLELFRRNITRELIHGLSNNGWLKFGVAHT